MNVSLNSARLRFSGVYSPELLYRANQATTDVSHFLNVFGTAELLTRTFFVDVRGAVSQQNVSLLGPQADSNLNVTTNRTTTKSYGISPYLRHDFGFDAFGELRYTHDSLRFGANSGTASDSTADRIDARLASGPAYKLFTWVVAYSKSRTDFSQSNQKIDAENYFASGGRLVRPDLRINATIGYEDSGYPETTGRELKGTYWSVGPEWTPSERTKISATIGRRYFGPSRTFNLEHRSRLTLWGLNYSESVTNTRNSLTLPVSQDTAAVLNAIFASQIPDPIAREAAVRDFINRTGLPASLTQQLNFLTDSLFVEKRLNGSFGILGVRNTILTNLFTSNRNSLTTGGSVGDFGSSTTVKQVGGSVTWSSRLTERLSSNVSLAVSRNEFSGLNRNDRRSALRLGVTKEFDPKVTGSLTVSRVKNDSDVATSAYSENSLTATLGMRF